MQTSKHSLNDATAQCDRMNAVQMAYVLLLTSVLSIWGAQNSINAYWQQTYHEDSPLTALNQFAFWQSGGTLQDFTTEKYQQLSEYIGSIDNQVVHIQAQTEVLPNNILTTKESLTENPSSISKTEETSTTDHTPSVPVVTSTPSSVEHAISPIEESIHDAPETVNKPSTQPSHMSEEQVTPLSKPEEIPYAQNNITPSDNLSKIGARDLTKNIPAENVPKVIVLSPIEESKAEDNTASKEAIGARDLTKNHAQKTVTIHKQESLPLSPLPKTTPISSEQENTQKDMTPSTETIPPAQNNTPDVTTVQSNTDKEKIPETYPINISKTDVVKITSLNPTEYGDLTVLHSGDKVFFAGDSLMQGVAPHVQKMLKNKYNIMSIDLSKQSTGLSYPKFYDWPAIIDKTLNEDSHIKLLVMFLGPNDPWDFPNPKGGKYLKFKSPEWEAEYKQRVDRILTAAEAHHVRVIWLGLPFMKANKLNEQMLYLDGILRDATRNRVTYISTKYNLTAGADHFTDPVLINGKKTFMRTKDGIHFTIAGQKLIAELIERRISYQPN